MKSKSTAKASPHPEWARLQVRPGTELRRINGRYYLYEVKCVYNAKLKRGKKVTGKILGNVTEDGFVESPKHRLARAAEKNASWSTSSVSQVEYGMSHYVDTALSPFRERLQVVFPGCWKELLMMAYCRLAWQSPIKNIPYRAGRSWLGVSLGLDGVGEKRYSAVLREVGIKREQAVKYMAMFFTQGDHVLADGTDLLCKSAGIDLARTGYSSTMEFEPQVELLYLYSAKERMPLYYRLTPGNVREVKSFAKAIEESGVKDVVAIADKGFYSDSNLTALEAENIRYVMPLRRNSSLIDYAPVIDGRIKSGGHLFWQEGRPIWYQEATTSGRKIHLYLDGDLAHKEEKDYLLRIQSRPDSHSMESYRDIRHKFGTVALVNNIEGTAEQAYRTYKSRLHIETLFDSLKNILDAGSSYMHDEDALQGWMFVNHLALQFYQTIYLELAQRKLLSKHSVMDVVMHLTEIRRIRINDDWKCAEIVGKTASLMKKLGVTIP